MTDFDANDFFRGTEYVADPYPYFAFLRGECPVRREPHHDVVMVTGYDEAVADFSVCIGTAPGLAGCFYNRALAYAASGRSQQAMRDYDRALQIDPAHASAALNRSMLHFQQGHLEQARADLRSALASGADPAAVHHDIALVDAAAATQPAR